jgi:hypothetical protein
VGAAGGVSTALSALHTCSIVLFAGEGLQFGDFIAGVEHVIQLGWRDGYSLRDRRRAGAVINSRWSNRQPAQQYAQALRVAFQVCGHVL